LATCIHAAGASQQPANHDQGVRPLSFKAEGGGVDHNADVSFDWDAGRASGVYEGPWSTCR